MKIRSRVAASAVAFLLVLGGGVVLAATTDVQSASAHTGDVKHVAVCNPGTGQYDVTSTLSLTNVDSRLSGTTYWRIGGVGFEGTPTNKDGLDRGPIGSTGNTILTLGSYSIPGTSKNGPWVYAYTSWTDGYGKGSDGRVEGLAGNCSKDVPPNPLDENITCDVAWNQPGRALTNGDHINIDLTQGGVKSQVNAYVDRNIVGGYDTLGLRLTVPSGQVTIPLTEAAVKTGRFEFNFGSYLTGVYTVEWAQFNSRYFNQDRDTAKFLLCGTPDKESVSGDLVFVDSTCVAYRPTGNSATLTLDGKTTAQFSFDGGPWTDIAAGTYSGSDLQIGTYEVVLTGEDGSTKSFSHTFLPEKTDGECAPPPGDPNPGVVLTSGCGWFNAELSNELGENGERLTASIVLYVNGTPTEFYAIEGGKTEIVKQTYLEDSGIYDIELRTGPAFGDVLLAQASVVTDCLPAEEPPVEAPDKELASAGADVSGLGLATALVMFAGAALLFASAARRKRVS